MSDKVILRLGDIIQLHAPTNMNYHDKRFFVESRDNKKITLISEDDASTKTLYIDEETNQLREESIEKIDILSRDENIGYARQNNLLPDTWIDIHFGGDVPLTITGRISDLEEDMIEITTYPENELLYIDFAYKSIPEDLPIDNIIIRQAPVDRKARRAEEELGAKELGAKELGAKELEEGEIWEEGLEDGLEEGEIREDPVVSKQELEGRLRDVIFDADQIQFGESLGTFMEKVSVSDGEKRYVGSSRVDLQACKLEYSIVSPK